MEPAHITRKKRDREHIRQRILDAALKIAVEENWEAVTMRKIAEAVAYTTTIVYGHFQNKEALLQEISDNGFTQLYALLQNAVKGGHAPQRQLLNLSVANWDFASEHQMLYTLMFTYKHPSFESIKEAMQLVEDVFRRLTGKKGKKLDTIILNWICLRQGCIGTLLNIKAGSDKVLKGHATKNLYIEFMNRFISSISSQD